MGSPPYKEVLVHAAQHHDPMLSDTLFKELNIDTLHQHLRVGSQGYATQVSIILERLDSIFDQERPDTLLVYREV